MEPHFVISSFRSAATKIENDFVRTPNLVIFDSKNGFRIDSNHIGRRADPVIFKSIDRMYRPFRHPAFTTINN
ncbi:hypothetical protein CRP01_20930 [Flavilitoribacter nigricans DSM 23189 = NBRC 102662]|uniref:Uncharacterized protein n=1 Tax=Flavilitoribacter nigricans (strain ATCC 23147 / DSM 23189 / NBRC 102662 / NCIMB 1420 / SS-2) TaxID=1122177 RepID=A0A2D0N7V1_FLAN2|nr:hypothetical protein CRP01_20930 [Flavilitoribacter nigricans DSM 23189 = NBRC 102662]